MKIGLIEFAPGDLVTITTIGGDMFSLKGVYSMVYEDDDLEDTIVLFGKRSAVYVAEAEIATVTAESPPDA